MSNNIQAAPADTGWRAEPATGADIIAEVYKHMAEAAEHFVEANEHMNYLSRHLNKIAELVNAL